MLFVILALVSFTISIARVVTNRNSDFSNNEETQKSSLDWTDARRSNNMARNNRDKWGGVEMKLADDDYDYLWDDDVDVWPRPHPITEFRNDCAVVVRLWKAFGKRTILLPGLVFRNGCCIGAPFLFFNDIPGVTCSDGHVVDIDWYNKGLVGPIPSIIKNLKNLKNIWLSHNQLTGPIPDEIGELTSLEGLWFNNNRFSGSIPLGLTSLENLVYLFINNNELTGEIPKQLGQLSNLEGLYLNNNQLSGIVPEELVSCKKLRYLYLSNNNFTGSLPKGITGLKDLKDIVTDPGL